MTEKRFTLHIKWYTYDKDEGDAELKDRGQPILLSESIDDMRHLKNLLNELHEENQRLKEQLQSEHQMLDNAILLERTLMGQNSLKQYKEAIQ